MSTLSVRSSRASRRKKAVRNQRQETPTPRVSSSTPTPCGPPAAARCPPARATHAPPAGSTNRGSSGAGGTRGPRNWVLPEQGSLWTSPPLPPSPGRSRPDCKRDTEQVFSKDRKGLLCSQFVQSGWSPGGANGSSVFIKSAMKPLPLQKEVRDRPWPWLCWDRGGPQGGASVVCPAAMYVLPLAVPRRLLNHRCSRSFGSAQTASHSFRAPLALSFPFRSTEWSHVGWSRVRALRGELLRGSSTTFTRAKQSLDARTAVTDLPLRGVPSLRPREGSGL